MFIHQLFEARVGEAPDSIALQYEDGSLTYRELNQRANRLARHLRSLGVGPEQVVGICLERSADLVVALFAVLKAGGACLALDPAYPPERLAHMLGNARAACLITQATAGARRAAIPDASRTVLLDRDRPAIDRENADDLPCVLQPSNLSFVFYTSGSTGSPKAVMWEHGDRDAQALWEKTTFGLTKQDPHLLKSAIGVTLLAAEIFLPLLSGGRLIIVPTGQESDTGHLTELIARHQVTNITLVPSMLRALVEHPEFPNCTSLREVCSFGEALTRSLQQRLHQHSGAALTVVYGTTEAPGSTFAQYDRHSPLSPTRMGTPRPGKAIYLIDSEFDRVGIGEQGEICIAGGLARGYMGRADLTAEKFVPNPFAGEAGARMYRTGDLGRYLPDGTIEFIGRADSQLKIRGFRVEAAEIEGVLCQHPAILQAAVGMREDPSGDARLVAWLALKQPAALSDGALRHYLADKLPNHMIPGVVVSVAALPLLPGGKLNRLALPDLEGSRLETDLPGVRARNDVEETLAAIWADVLDLPAVGVLDDFFDLGGDSLAAMRVIGRVVQTFRSGLSLKALFDAPTVAAMARVIAGQQSKEGQRQSGSAVGSRAR